MFRTSEIGLDLGNSKFSICIKGEGIVASQASYLAYSGERLTESSVIAIGEEAKSMFERSHDGIKVTSPMSEGVIVDCYAASILLKKLIKNAGVKPGFRKPNIVVGALYGSSGIERKAFKDVAESLNSGKIQVVDEPIAAALATHWGINSPYANMVLDIGDGATEAVITSQGKTILGSSMRFGGSDIDLLLVDHVRKKHGLKISVSQARRIKESLPIFGQSKRSVTSLRVRGVGVSNLMPAERQIPVASFAEVISKFADKIATFTLNLLSRTPPEVSVDLIENGIFLCGGASQANLIKERLEEVTRLSVNAVDKPQEAVIAGIYKMLDFTRYLA